MANLPDSSGSPSRDEFLLTAYREYHQVWRHVDLRIKNAITIYSTGCAAIVTFLGLSYNKIQPFKLTYALIAAVLLASGFILRMRIIETWNTKKQCAELLEKTWEYFVDKELPPSIDKAPSIHRTKQESHSIKQESHNGGFYQFTIKIWMVALLIVWTFSVLNFFNLPNNTWSAFLLLD